jgi:hypothetical protein
LRVRVRSRRMVEALLSAALLAASLTPVWAVAVALAPSAALAAGAAKKAHPSTAASATQSPGGVGVTSNPLSGFPAPPIATSTGSTPTVVPNASTSASGDSSLSGSSAIAIALGAVVVLAGISFFIWRDARRRAPVRAGGEPGSEGRNRTGSKPPPKPRKLSAAERKRRKRGRARR